MRHFTTQNLHLIKDAPPRTWATVDSDDVETFSELSRCGFHLVDMRGPRWVMIRAG